MKIASNQLLDSINNAMSEDETSEEISIRSHGKEYFKRVILKKEY